MGHLAFTALLKVPPLNGRRVFPSRLLVPSGKITKFRPFFTSSVTWRITSREDFMSSLSMTIPFIAWITCFTRTQLDASFLITIPKGHGHVSKRARESKSPWWLGNRIKPSFWGRFSAPRLFTVTRPEWLIFLTILLKNSYRCSSVWLSDSRQKLHILRNQ